ncbi:MAG: peptidoglycan DD-metalloendopeptidase family protein [Methylocystis sp.]|uniref:peptidoglycan DD-metalloendopeptidase family protein n=1 Tax=Methylocystis sp. TaxID=1911079 RepID=UPI003DA52D46
MAGCSDASRFSDPFSDPFSSGSATKVARRGVDRAPTGSIAAPADGGEAAPAPLPGRVESRPLPATNAPVASAQPQPQPTAPRAATPVASAPASGGAGLSHWTSDGGTPVTVGPGETATMLATRYGVPPDALLRANGYSNAAQVQPGARLIIPVYRAGAVASSTPAAPARVAAPVAAAPVAKPEPKVASASEKTKAAEDAKSRKAEALTREQDAKRAKKAEADKAAEEARVAAATKAVDPKKLAEAKQADAKAAKAEAKSKADMTAKADAAKAEKQAKADAAKAEKLAKAEEAAPVAKTEKPAKTAAAEKPAEPARSVEKTTAAASPAPAQAEEATKVSTSDPDRPEFRWPAKGRIIQGFSSGGNDGINIAVPEGTPVKAAEGGQVAYAGSELKGYGNLVLIRHPNGFVTAYAHNGELEVKRGDTVKRGQTIAKSGQSGNVGSPQLHFELRKGATPVDPTSYLAGL